MPRGGFVSEQKSNDVREKCLFQAHVFRIVTRMNPELSDDTAGNFLKENALENQAPGCFWANFERAFWGRVLIGEPKKPSRHVQKSGFGKCSMLTAGKTKCPPGKKYSAKRQKSTICDPKMEGGSQGCLRSYDRAKSPLFQEDVTTCATKPNENSLDWACQNAPCKCAPEQVVLPTQLDFILFNCLKVP